MRQKELTSEESRKAASDFSRMGQVFASGVLTEEIKKRCVPSLRDYWRAAEDEGEQPAWNQLLKEILILIIKDSSGSKEQNDSPSQGGMQGEMPGHEGQREASAEWVIKYIMPAERFRQQVTQDYFARDAAKMASVISFREEYFGGAVLTEEEYETALGSPLSTWYKCVTRDDEGEVWIKAESDPSLRFRLRPSFRSPTYELYEVTCVRNPKIFPGAVIDRWRTTSAWMSKIYGWTPEQMMKFLCTGRQPEIDMVQADFHYTQVRAAHKTPSFVRLVPRAISLTVPSWLPPSTVAAIYRYLQNQIYYRHTESKNRTGAREAGGRRISHESLALFNFVSERRFISGCELSWTLSDRQRIFSEWEKTYPSRGYNELRRFIEEYHRIEKIILSIRE